MASYDMGSAYGRIIIDTANVNRAATAFAAFSRTMLGIGVAAGAGFGVAAKAAADFERNLDLFSAVTGETAANMEKVRAKVLQIGQDSIFSAGQVAVAVAEMAKAGINTDDILSGAADAAVALAAATDTDLLVATEVAAGAMNTFNLTGKDMNGIVDSIARAVNASSINVQDLAYSLKYAGGPAAQLGLSIEETTAAIGLLGKAGITGSTAGTSLRRILLNLSPASKEAEAAMRELGIITADGTNQFYNAAGGAKSMEEIMGILNTATKDLTASQKLQYLNTIFGNRAVGSAVLLANQGAEGFRKYTDELNALPSAAQTASARLDNLSGDIEILKGNLQTMLVDAGSPFQQQLREWVKELTKLVQAFNDLDPATQKAIFQFLGYTAVIATGLGLMTAFVGGILKFISAVKAIGAAFSWMSRVTGLATLFGKVWYELQFLFLRLTTAIGPFSKIMGTLARVIGPVVTAVTWLARGIALVAAAIAGSTIALVVLAVVALGAAFFAAYKYIKPFHEAVDATWQAIQKAWDAVLGFARDLPGKLVAGFNTATTAISNFITSAVTFFQQLPGRIIAYFLELPGKIANSLLTLAPIVAYWLGFALGSIVRFVIDGTLKAAEFGINFVTTIANFLQELPGKVWNFLVATFNFMVQFTTDMLTKAIEVGTRVRDIISQFISELPGRIWGFLVAAYNFAVQFEANMRQKAIEVGTNFVNGVIQFLTELPGKTIEWLNKAVDKAVEFGTKFVQKAKDIAKDFVKGLVDGLQSIPGEIDKVITSLIGAINGAKDRLYEAIKSVGQNLVKGFLDGLDKHSPSAIERAMFEVVDGVGGSMKDLQDHVKTVHALAGGLGNFDTEFKTNLNAAALKDGGSSGDLSMTFQFNGVSSEDIPAIKSAVTSSEVLSKLTLAARAGRR